MRCLLAKPLLCLICCAVLNLGIKGQSLTGSITLKPGETIEKPLSASQSHDYTITLSDEQFFQFVVTQKGIDVIVRVFSPTGESLGNFDTPNGADGPENGSVVAVIGGAYRIVVAPLDQSGTVEPGRYEIKILELRQATEQELKSAKNSGNRKEKGLALLNEIVESIPEIRQSQTRIRIKLDAANLLWTIEEKRARKLLTEAMTDSREYLATIKLDDEHYEEISRWAYQLRYEIVQTLAFYDPETALELLRLTRKPKDEDNFGRRDTSEEQFELGLAQQIATKNPQRAFEMAKESLKTGYSPSLLQTLIKLKQRDPELGSRLTTDILRKLSTETMLKNGQALELTMSLLRVYRASAKAAVSQQSATKDSSLLTQEDFKSLIQKLLNEALAANPPTKGQYSSESSAAQSILFTLKSTNELQLDSVVPGANAAIDKKINELQSEAPWKEWQRLQTTVSEGTPNEAMEAISQAAPQAKDNLLHQLAERTMNSGDFAKARQLVTEQVGNPRQRQLALNNLERAAALRDASEGKIEDALGHVVKLPSARDRARVLIEFASRIGPGYKREVALTLLESALDCLSPTVHAEDQDQMNARLQIAVAFSRYDSKRAFEIVEPLVNQFNEITEAARTMNGFGADFFVEGELSQQNGNGLAAIANPIDTALRSLSLVDFDRAKLISDRLKLPEVRVAVHLGLAQRAILPNGPYSASAAYLNTLNR